VAAGIAGDQFDLGTEDILQDARKTVRLGARSFARERKRLGQDVLPGLDRRRVPGCAQARARGDAAEPGEAAAVELGLAEERLKRRAASDRGDDAAVLRSDGVDVHRGLETS